MSKGKKKVSDFIPAGTHENQTGDPTDEFLSATDIGLDFTTQIITNPADVNEQ